MLAVRHGSALLGGDALGGWDADELANGEGVMLQILDVETVPHKGKFVTVSYRRWWWPFGRVTRRLFCLFGSHWWTDCETGKHARWDDLMYLLEAHEADERRIETLLENERHPVRWTRPVNPNLRRVK
jgi:hypothetical protein